MDRPSLGIEQNITSSFPTVAAAGPSMLAPSGFSQGPSLHAAKAATTAQASAAAFSQNVARTAPATLAWLHEHFEAADGISLGRSTLYQHYCDHCTLNRYDPVNQASFGKLIRSVFPNLKTRRLGTRGNSKYHYYGIRLRDSSALLFPVDQIGGAHNRYRSRAPSDKPKAKKPMSSASKPEPSDVEIFLNSGVVLPEFPVMANDDFSRVYHTHCKEVVRLAGKADFSKIQPLWEKFWSSQNRPMLSSPAGIAHVLKCDDIFFGVLSRALMVDIIAPVPESLVKEIRFFAKCLDPWMRTAMEKQPALYEARLPKIRLCTHNLRRFTALTHLAQAARGVFANEEQMTQMFLDLSCLDFSSVHLQALSVCGCDDSLVVRLETDFKQCLQARHTAEQWVVWLQKVLRDYVAGSDAMTACRRFLTRWSFYSSIVIRDLTLRSAPSFGSFHLIRLFFDEYIFYLVEQVAEKGPVALTTEYRPVARRAPPASEGEEDEEEEEDFDGDDGEGPRAGLPSLTSFMGASDRSSPLSDILKMEKF